MMVPAEPPSRRLKAFAALRELLGAYRAFYWDASWNVQQFGLTLEQFDVVATLGNTAGMDLLQLQTRVLMIQKELQGLLEELIACDIVLELVVDAVTIYQLTPLGHKVFQVSFQDHAQYLEQRFGELESSEIEFLQHILRHLRQAFNESSVPK
jgi:DNA-binding MarR family transcriptional regulator